MKILITCGIFEPDSGGPATYAPQLAKELISRGYEVDIITLSDKEKYDFDNQYNFKLIRIVRGNKISNYSRMFFRLLKIVKHYDFVYTLDWLTVGLPLALACSIKRQKYIVRIGGGYIWERYLLLGLPPMSLGDFYKRGLHKKYPAFFYLIKFVLKSAEIVIFNSIKQRELFHEYYNLKKERLYTIFNPVPKDIIAIDRNDIKNEIAFAGRFIVMKNLENLIKGFEIARLEGYKLKLIGDGPILDNMKLLVKDLGIVDMVEFLPPMRKLELYKYLQNVKYIVLSSWTDIQPMQFFESIYAGIPLLLTQENYLAESDELSIHIDPNSPDDIAEKMIYLSKDENYQKFCDEFSKIKVTRGWKEVADMHEEIFEKISTKSEARNPK